MTNCCCREGTIITNVGQAPLLVPVCYVLVERLWRKGLHPNDIYINMNMDTDIDVNTNINIDVGTGIDIDIDINIKTND